MRAIPLSFALAFVLCNTSFSAETKPSDINPLDQEIFAGSYEAGYHTRYHHEMAQNYAWWDFAANAGMMITSFIAIVVPLVVRFKSKRWQNTMIGIGGASFIISILLLMVSWGTARVEHAVLAKQWNALKTEWDELGRQMWTLSSDELTNRVDRLMQERVAIENLEPIGYNKKKLKVAMDEESVSRGIGPPKESAAAAPTKTTGTLSIVGK